jgi:hypothetical protein
LSRLAQCPTNEKGPVLYENRPFAFGRRNWTRTIVSGYLRRLLSAPPYEATDTARPAPPSNPQNCPQSGQVLVDLAELG